MKVVISIHDISPYFEKEIDIILKELECVKKSFLITPLWQEHNHFNNDFSSKLFNEDLVLHGLTHFTRKADLLGKSLLASASSLKEFYGLDKIETEQKIKTSLAIFEDIFLRTPAGFIPPMWYHNKHTLEVLKELGFIFTESNTAFINFQKNKTLFSIPACFDFGNNHLLNKILLKSWKHIFKHFRQPLLRYSIHPADIKNGFCKDITETIKWMQEREYTFLTYNELIKN